mgnify:CR=1 FL=1
MKKNAKMQPMDANELMESYHNLPDDYFTPVQWIISQLMEISNEMQNKPDADDYQSTIRFADYIIYKIMQDKLLECELKRGVIKRSQPSKRKQSIIKIQTN